METRLPHNSQWMISTFKTPTIFNRAHDEVWLLNPVTRYVFNANHLTILAEHVESISDVKSSAHYRALDLTKNIAGARILVERYRDRGIGDLLFMTGPLGYLRHVTGGEVKVDFYAFSERGQVLLHNPVLHHQTVLVGPQLYDNFAHYNYQWLVETVTEWDEEPDQLNVYDALFKQMGVNPDTVEPRFKRPTIVLDPEEQKNLDQFFYFVWLGRKFDMRKTGYYVVAPFSHSSLRSAKYSTWLEIIKEMSGRRPVVVVGQVTDRMPDTDITSGEFIAALDKIGPQVVNATGSTPLRLLINLMAKASCAVCLDSGPLYLAQGVRTPAISLWGSHDPGVRLGYDPDYMDLAIWKPDACNHSPCFAYAGFPEHKCPLGPKQQLCEVMENIEVSDVFKKLNAIESRHVNVGPFVPKGESKK
jgi:ADP-heptose:LPS heptosyltransferase